MLSGVSDSNVQKPRQGYVYSSRRTLRTFIGKRISSGRRRRPAPQKPGVSSLFDAATEIFSDTAGPEVIDRSFRRDGLLIDSFPQPAERSILKARAGFYQSDQEGFQVALVIGKDIQLTGTDGLSDADYKVLRERFAEAWLKAAGISKNKESVRLAKKMFPLKADKIRLEKDRYGQRHRITVTQKPRAHVAPRIEHEMLESQCKIFREQVGRAWTVLDRAFPRDSRKPMPPPFVPRPRRIQSQLAVQKSRPMTDRCPTTLKMAGCRGARPRSPFPTGWELLLSRSAVEGYVQAFMEESGLDRPDSPCPFSCGPVTRRRAVRFITNGYCARIVYHTARYFHSLFVLQLDDFPNFIRAKAVWEAISKQLSRSIPSVKILSIALTAIKACVASIFEDQSGVQESQLPEMESTVFRAVWATSWIRFRS
jgi:hypothetical protein